MFPTFGHMYGMAGVTQHGICMPVFVSNGRVSFGKHTFLMLLLGEVVDHPRKIKENRRNKVAGTDGINHGHRAL